MPCNIQTRTPSTTMALRPQCERGSLTGSPCSQCAVLKTNIVLHTILYRQTQKTTTNDINEMRCALTQFALCKTYQNAYDLDGGARRARHQAHAQASPDKTQISAPRTCNNQQHTAAPRKTYQARSCALQQLTAAAQTAVSTQHIPAALEPSPVLGAWPPGGRQGGVWLHAGMKAHVGSHTPWL